MFLHQVTTTILALVPVLECRFGNCVEDSDAAFSFTPQAEGPGPVDAVMVSTQAGPARLQLLARQSGTYSLTLVSTSQEALGSGAIQVNCDCRFAFCPFKANSSTFCLPTRQTPLSLHALHVT